MDNKSYVEKCIGEIESVDQKAMEEAAARQDQLTKPPGSLGRLEELSIKLAGIARSVPYRIEGKHIFTMAADHGVAKAGVSPYPQEVTAQMVLNFLGGGAAISVLARHVGADLIVVDTGVASDLPEAPGLIHRKIAYGTANIAEGPAMTEDQAWQCLCEGIKLVEDLPEGFRLVGLGDMGIGNTTPSSAIISVITETSPLEVAGPGTGLDTEGVKRKAAIIEKAISVNNPDRTNGIDVLARVGGYEISGLAGVIIGCAKRGFPVLIDGFITTAAALIAVTVAPSVKPFLIASHRSAEPGHRIALDYLELEPILELRMRLGEGTGAALAMSIVEASAKILSEMKTFAEAGVSSK